MLLQYKHFTTPEMEQFIPPERLEEQIKFDITRKIAEALYGLADYRYDQSYQGKIRTIEIVTLPPINYRHLSLIAKRMWYDQNNIHGKDMITLLQLDKLVL